MHLLVFYTVLSHLEFTCLAYPTPPLSLTNHNPPLLRPSSSPSLYFYLPPFLPPSPSPSLSFYFSLLISSQATKPCQDITATVTRFTVVPDLTFKFYDHIGNEAKTNKIRSWEMKVTLLGGTVAVAEAKVKMSTIGTMTLPLKFSKAFELLDKGQGQSQTDGDSFTLQVTSFFTMTSTSGKVHLEEGSIHCTKVRLNTVTSVLLSLIRDSTSSKRKRRKGGKDVQVEDDDAHLSGDEGAKEGGGTLHIYLSIYLSE